MRKQIIDETIIIIMELDSTKVSLPVVLKKSAIEKLSERNIRIADIGIENRTTKILALIQILPLLKSGFFLLML